MKTKTPATGEPAAGVKVKMNWMCKDIEFFLLNYFFGEREVSYD